eukprot:366369-Chlamydomonas_euryale.AAC.9
MQHTETASSYPAATSFPSDSRPPASPSLLSHLEDCAAQRRTGDPSLGAGIVEARFDAGCRDALEALAKSKRWRTRLRPREALPEGADLKSQCNPGEGSRLERAGKKDHLSTALPFALPLHLPQLPLGFLQRAPSQMPVAPRPTRDRIAAVTAVAAGTAASGFAMCCEASPSCWWLAPAASDDAHEADRAAVAGRGKGVAGRGKGVAGRGRAWQGVAGRGKGVAGLGKGVAGRGRAWQGKDGRLCAGGWRGRGCTRGRVKVGERRGQVACAAE